MNLRHAHIPAVKSQGGGPGEYFNRAKDSHGKVRIPSPQKLQGDPKFFDRLVRLSSSPHPHLHAILGYRGDVNPPAREIKNRVLQMYLSLMRGGLTENKIYVLAYDHGDHDHVAIYRHVIDKKWPRFQPYYHKNDWLLVSDFQWLVNLRYGLNGPENPRNAQVVSLAGRHFGNAQVKLLADLRRHVANWTLSGQMKDHEGFVSCLKKKLEWTFEVIPASDDDAATEENTEATDTKRFWGKIIAGNTQMLIKGPPCNPSFVLAEYKSQQLEKAVRYQQFLTDPSIIAERFFDGVRKRRAFNRQHFPAFYESENSNPYFEYEELLCQYLPPSRTVSIPSPGLA